MEFYVVDTDLFNDKEYAYGEQVDLNTGESEKCEICGLAVGSRRWLPPHTVKLSKPSYGDFVFGSITFFLASQKFKDEYLKSELIGIKEFELADVVKISRKKNLSPEPPIYYNVLVGRGEAKIDEVKSKFVREGRAACNHCRIGGVIKSFQGVFLEENTWSGEDIFTPRGLPGTIMVSNRFCDFVKEKGFTNIKFVKAEDYVAPWVRSFI